MGDRGAITDLQARAAKLREDVVTVAAAQPAHLGGSMSCADLMAALFFHALRLDEGETRDHFLLSKGHAGPGGGSAGRGRTRPRAEQSGDGGIIRGSSV